MHHQVAGDVGAGEPEVAGAADASSVGSAVSSAAWYSFRLAAAGFLVGSFFGFALALLMQRIRIAERALMPWAVLSQTVPLIALAPLVYGWGANLTLFGLDWQPWMSVSISPGRTEFTRTPSGPSSLARPIASVSSAAFEPA